MRRIYAVLLSTSLLATAACQNGPGYNENPNTYKGAGIGAAVGAGAGAIFGHNKVGSAAAGAAIGGLVGGGIGQYMDRQEAQMRDQLAGSGIDVRRDGNNILLNMPNSITFGFNSSAVSSASEDTLHDIATVLNQYPETNVQVIGHTDDIGGPTYNIKLSQQRAQAVTARLIAHGVASSRLTPIGRGEGEPIVANTSEANRAQNRRVEVKITPTAGAGQY